MYEKRIDEVVCQRIYGVLPLNYGAMIEIKVAPVGLEPRLPAPEACTPTRQSIVVSYCFYRSGRRGSRTLKACHASSSGFQPGSVAIRFALPKCASAARPGIEPGTSR